MVMFSCDYMTDFMPGMSGRLTASAAAAWLEVLRADAHSRRSVASCCCRISVVAGTIGPIGGRCLVSQVDDPDADLLL